MIFYPLSVLTFWFDPDCGSTIYKTHTIICSTCFEFAPDLSFTLSAGIAEYNDEYNEKMWLDVADKAMYYSKEHGRNQIHVAE